MKASELNTAVFTFGRFNPPTIGHARLVDMIKRQPGKPYVFLSHTQKPKTDPLSYGQKLTYAKTSFPDVAIGDYEVKTVIQALQKLESLGYSNVIMIVGSDRVDQFKEFVPKYNGKDYKFDSIKIISAGERDPDSEGVEGMSASKMRKFAVDKDFENFKTGVINKADAKKMYDEVRAGMGLTEVKTTMIKRIMDADEVDERSLPPVMQSRPKIDVINNIAMRKDDRPFPLSYKDTGGAATKGLFYITPQVAKKFINFFDRTNDENQNYVTDALKSISKTAKIFKDLGLQFNVQMQPAESINEAVTNKPDVYVDMDGVIADFFSALAKFRGTSHWKDEGGKVSVEDSIKAIAGTDFFSTLPVFPTAKQLISTVKNFTGGEWYICSSPLRGDHENSKKHKLDWLNTNGFDPMATIITGRKEKHATTKDNQSFRPNILIDDKPSNIERWQMKNGIALRYQANKDSLSRVNTAFQILKDYMAKKQGPWTPEEVRKVNSAIDSGSQVAEGLNEGDLIPFPDNTLVVDIDSKNDYYELTKDISNLDQSNRSKYGPKGKPDTLIIFQNEKVKNEYKKRIKKHTGLNSRDTTHSYLYHDPDKKPVNEYGRVVQGINTTADVATDAIKKQSGKMGFKVDKDGYPPILKTSYANKKISEVLQEDELKFQNEKGNLSLNTLPGTKKWQKAKKNSKPGTQDWFKTWRTMPFLTKGRKNHYMLPIKEKIEILMHNIDLLEKWSQKYKKSINCSNPKGFSQKAHCAGKKK